MTISLRSYVHTPLPLTSSMKIHRVKAITAMKVEIQSRKLIKPSVPTPPTLRHYKISFIDEFAPKIYVPLVLFFPPNTNYNPRSVAQLEESLEKTLTLMYPLAGRYMEDIRTVDCNDQGAEFIQAQVDITIQEIHDLKVDPKQISEFIPFTTWATDQVTDAILATQVTRFQCGGLALGVSIAHRIGDASTMITFLNRWATLSRRDTKVESVGMGFLSSSLFPARGLPFLEVGLANLNNDDYVTKKLSFNESAISNLKAKATLNGKIDTHQLSKVQLVSALIWKVFIGVDRAIYGYPRDSVLFQPLNLRQKSTSLIPKNAFGNLWGLIVTECRTSKMIKEFEELTDLLADSVMKTIKDYSKARHDNHEMKEMLLNSFSHITNIPDTTNVICLTSWCKFPFYGVNFGFGKPIWFSCGCAPFKRGVVLLDDAGGNGVEAYVSMGVKDVPYFEQDEDIKAFSV